MKTSPSSSASSITTPENLRTNRGLLQEVRRLSKISEILGLWGIVVQWLVIVGVVALWYHLPENLGALRWVLYAVCVVIIGSRQHALLIMMHDAAHGRISAHRPWNDFVSDMFCSYPHGLSTELYRRRHLKHHKHTNSDDDPDWVIIKPHKEWHWPKDQIEAFRIFAFDLIGLAAHKILIAFMIWSPARKLFFRRKLSLTPAERLRLLTFCATVVTVLSIFHFWTGFLLFWVVPFLTAFVAISRMRTVAEHMVVESEHELNKSRHVDPTFIERLVFSPLNVNYHLTHHLFPSVPYYRLPEMHRILLKEKVFREHAHLTTSYWGMRHGVWAEVTKKGS